MQKLNFRTNNTRYHKSAQRAINAERSGDYQSAAMHWVNAGNAASNPANRQWAAERMEFCGHAHVSGWGSENARV